MRVLNIRELTSHGNVPGRRALVEIVDAGLQAADPYSNTRQLVQVRDGRIIVGDPQFEPHGSPVTGEDVYNLDEIGRIFVFGAGKGIQRVAKALEDAIGEHLSGGHVIDKKGHPVILERIGVTLGGHPVPDEDCVHGCQRILEMLEDLRSDDLVFTCVANGVSALLTLPVPGLTLEDVKATTRIMQIEHGAPTHDLNPIRNHLDMLKGGRISRRIAPARAVHIIAIEPGSYGALMHENYWLHSLPDATTYAQAIDNLKRWDAWDKVPAAVREFLQRRDPAHDTVKAEEYARLGQRIFGVMPGPYQTAKVPAAMRKAEALGYRPYFIGEEISAIEASQAAAYLAEIAKTVERRGGPFEPPCALFTSGEMVVTVGKGGGIGGRNQEFALAAARRIAGSKRIVIASVDTDGTDGPGGRLDEDDESYTCLAGGIVDGYTAHSARRNGVDIDNALRCHDTTRTLLRLGSGITAEPNISLNDLTVALIMHESQANKESETWPMGHASSL